MHSPCMKWSNNSALPPIFAYSSLKCSSVSSYASCLLYLNRSTNQDAHVMMFSTSREVVNIKLISLSVWIARCLAMCPFTFPSTKTYFHHSLHHPSPVYVTREIQPTILQLQINVVCSLSHYYKYWLTTNQHVDLHQFQVVTKICGSSNSHI